MKAEPEDAAGRSPHVWLGPAQDSTLLPPVTHQVLPWPLVHFILLTMQQRQMDAGTQRGGVHQAHPDLGNQFSPSPLCRCRPGLPGG